MYLLYDLLKIPTNLDFPVYKWCIKHIFLTITIGLTTFSYTCNIIELINNLYYYAQMSTKLTSKNLKIG